MLGGLGATALCLLPTYMRKNRQMTWGGTDCTKAAGKNSEFSGRSKLLCENPGTCGWLLIAFRYESVLESGRVTIASPL